MDESTSRFSTGIRFLDMQFGGGIPPGDVVALVAPPDSQSEVFFKELAREQPLRYASTIAGNEAELEEWVQPAGHETGDVSVTHLDPESFQAEPEEVLGDLGEKECLVVDPIDELEAGARKRYLAGLNTLKDRLRMTDSIAVVHCLDGQDVPDQRSLTLKRADHVWRLRQTVKTEELSTRLYVPKSRAGQPITEAIRLELSDRVDIDTSRNIA